MDNENYKKNSTVCNCLNLRRASQSITSVYDGFLAVSGLKISQYSILYLIRLMQSISVSDLAVKIRLDRTTMVRNLKPLEERGFITDIAPKGTRNRQLELTEKGNEVYEMANKCWEEAQDFVEKQLGKDDLNTLTLLLSKIEALVP